MPDLIDGAKAPPNVTLYDVNDYPTHRQLIFDGAKQTMIDQFPIVHNGVRMELSDVDYADKDHYTRKEQQDAKLSNKYLARRLRGTVRLFDDTTGEKLDEKQTTLMRVPYLTDNGTFIRDGVSYTSLAQARLIPGSYSRTQSNGELETQFNVRAGTGNAFRVAMNPETKQYKLRVRGSEIHLYSLLNALGVPDEQLEQAWGADILNSNREGYDSKAIDRAYTKVVPEWNRTANPDRTEDDKVGLIKDSLDKAQIATNVVKRTLPNLFDSVKTASWRRGGRFMEKLANFTKADMQALAMYINQVSGKNIIVDGSKDEIEQAVRLAIQEAGINISLYDSALHGINQAAETGQQYPSFEAPKISKIAAVKMMINRNKAKPSTPMFSLDDDGEEYTPVGVDGLLAASEKLLAINRGLVPTDERDSLAFKKVFRTHALINERIRMDAGKVRRGVMYQAARNKSLKGLAPLAFDPYVQQHLVGNPLTSPSEETNPLLLYENARRVTLMGPGGLSSDDSITEEAQTTHPSQFGFISPVESPESSRAGIDTRITYGARLGSDGRLYQKLKNHRTGEMEWYNPEQLSTLTVKIPD
ncbi:MAG: hypothetical protein RR182_00295 [Alistipes sp.]